VQSRVPPPHTPALHTLTSCSNHVKHAKLCGMTPISYLRAVSLSAEDPWRWAHPWPAATTHASAAHAANRADRPIITWRVVELRHLCTQAGSSLAHAGVAFVIQIRAIHTSAGNTRSVCACIDAVATGANCFAECAIWAVDCGACLCCLIAEGLLALVGIADEGSGALALSADAFACYTHVIDGAPAAAMKYVHRSLFECCC
jgi:hypothetical protein